MTKTSLEKVTLAPFVKKSKNITLFFIFILFLLLFLPWEQTTKGTGELIAYNPSERDYTIHAPISGFVKSYAVEEDQFVKKGDLLFEMLDLDALYTSKLQTIQNDIQIQFSNTQNQLQILQTQEGNLQENFLTGLAIHTKKIAQIQDSLTTLQMQKTQHANNLEIAHKNYERVKLLYKDGIESERQYELAQNNYLHVKTLFKNIKIAIEREQKTFEIQKKEKQSYTKLQENSIKTLQSNILTTKNRLKSLEQQITQASINLSRNSSAKVYATRDGYPLRILKNDKDRYIKQGEKLIHFSPKITKKVLLLKVRALDMPLIKKGLKARIQFYGWPSLQVSGWPKITYGTFGGIVEKIDPIAHEDGFYYLYITQDPKEPWPDNDILKIGTKASAWIRLSTVQIWYEIWRLHNALPLIMTQTTEADK